MSKLETGMTRRYWERVGGTLIEEFCAVRKTPKSARRLLDGVIILCEDHRLAKQAEVSIEGKDVIVVQTKAKRLGMYLMGQALFSLELMREFKPRSIRSVALCNKDDEVLREIFLRHSNVEVVIDDSVTIEDRVAVEIIA